MDRTDNVKHEGWHLCGRCGEQYPMSQLTWQIGSLRCPPCYDDPLTVLPSIRDERIARVLQYVPQGGEPEIEPKLRQPGQMSPWTY